jgi:hypothetical protein
LVDENNDEADAVNVSPPLIKLSEDMYGEGGKTVPALVM